MDTFEEALQRLIDEWIVKGADLHEMVDNLAEAADVVRTRLIEKKDL